MEAAQKAGFGDFTATDNPAENGTSPDDVEKIFTQVGGTFVLRPGNSCDFAHRSKFAGDAADMGEVMKAAFGLEDYVYPSTKAWVKKLGSGTAYRSSGSSGSDEDAEAYLEGLRKDAEGRAIDGEEDEEKLRRDMLRKDS